MVVEHSYLLTLTTASAYENQGEIRMVYKRWKGKKLKPGDPNNRARWWMEYRLNGRRVYKAISEARTKAPAKRAEVSEREAIYNNL